MDSMITAAARALAAGDALGALNRVALRDDAPALAMRGIAMAQLGDFARAKDLLRRAERAFEPGEALARARCVVAAAEVALASRARAWAPHALETARATLASHGDAANAAHAAYLDVRRLVLIGRLPEARSVLDGLDASRAPAPLAAAHHLAVASIAMRHARAKEARNALTLAANAARRAGIPALSGEVAAAQEALATPAARVAQRPVLLDEVERILASNALVVDACRLVVRQGGASVALVSRPVLFALVRALAEAWPRDVGRDTLVAHAFRARKADESYRARLRVEMGRLRSAIRGLASVTATKQGFVLEPRVARSVVVLARPVEEKHGGVLALLADGEAWSTSALALAMDASQRNVQRALEALASQGKVQAVGRGRARRWMTPPDPAFATALLLPAPPATD
jgi:hypothetical protein